MRSRNPICVLVSWEGSVAVMLMFTMLPDVALANMYMKVVLLPHHDALKSIRCYGGRGLQRVAALE